MTSPSGCLPAVRRYSGAETDEVSALLRLADASGDAVRQAETAYRELAALLAAEGASFLDVAGETLFLRDVTRDAPRVLAARDRVLAAAGQAGDGPPPACIGQAPLASGAGLELLASAVIPRRRDAWSVRDVQAEPACACAACARSAARLMGRGDRLSVRTGTVYGAGPGAFEQTLAMFEAAERLLAECGMTFRDVVRTWIHLRDIDRDYDALNAARREFFRRRGIERRPASTGVQGIPFPDAHDCGMSLYAVRAPGSLEVATMSTPALNEAWSYGADFSRGLRVVDGNTVALYVSGTASIDEEGRTVHAGDFAAQAGRMLHNIASLLAGHGATFAHLVSGVAYLKRPGDAAALHAICRQRGFDGFPCAVVEAPLCRPELLCETEAVALLPLPHAGR